MPKCKHEFSTEIHLGRCKHDVELIYILGQSVLVETCQKCGHEQDIVFTGGVICNGGFRDADAARQRLTHNRQKKSSKKVTTVEM